MFQTFTGSSRRPRQVNLSGRTANPFAAVGAGPGAGSQSAVASAQQERAQRQREREKLQSAKTIQRSWRGHKVRRRVYAQLRQDWDATEASGDESEPYATEAEAFSQLQRLLLFVNLNDETDLVRLRRYCKRQMGNAFSGGSWPIAYMRLQKTILDSVERQVNKVLGGADFAPKLAVQGRSSMTLSLETLCFLNEMIPRHTAENATQYYRAMGRLIRAFDVGFDGETDAQLHQDPWKAAVLTAVVSPLQKFHAGTAKAYEAFACLYLPYAGLSAGPRFRYPNNQPGTRHEWLDQLASKLNYKLLAHSLAECVRSAEFDHYQLNSSDRLALLTYFIYCHRHAHNFENPQAYSSDKDFVCVVSNLLSSLSDVMEDVLEPNEQEESRIGILYPLINDQIMSLVDEASIRSLLADRTSGSFTNEARELASYALTLIRFFPRRGDEIRMWLYLGSSAGQSTPAIKYFYQAVRSTSVMQQISKDSRAAVGLLKSNRNDSPLYGQWQAPGRSQQNTSDQTNKEWQVILIFLELFIFVLKVMDDDEFFSGGNPSGFETGARSSRVRENALPLSDVRDLIMFLKNLGFAMYFNASEILGDDERERETSGGISSFFRLSAAGADTVEDDEDEKKRRQEMHTIGGVAGMTLEYVKGLVTGLLRMVYERDSRRKFLPADHWLMTSRFDMGGFISAVVQEEESRNRLQEEDSEDAGNMELDQDIDGLELPESSQLIGTRRTQQARHLERLQRQQRKASRKRYLQLVAPRLEILQNMPFFIPFTMRVQIFREFVRLDQMKRRHGRTDPDQWRMAMMHEFQGQDIGRHHAKVRRGYEFDDAFDQFYTLGDGLKEPIQITFVDQFDTVEAGIDGGGVTKEFLTSVTNQAFAPSEDKIDLFVENDAHLLYPNPSSVEATKHIMRMAGITEGSQIWRERIQLLLARYEFLGRIVGKCLYEGILVDINFAPFFLLKWSLTGGTNSASKESSYRANLNDLRDLDESLYQGLLQLKNYPGNVEEDLSLYFTITDTIHGEVTKTIELRPNGANTPVTNENRLVYISYVVRHRLQSQQREQTAAFLRGLSAMISPSWLSMFNQGELQTLIGGTSSSIDVADLRAHTQYGGVYAIGDDGLEHPSVRLFWRVMQSLSDADRRAVLKFVTSTPRAPLLGFASLNPRFSIRDAGNDETRLPSTSTCVNLLKLPMYRHEDVLREKLLYAVNSGAGFDLS
ncbi:hypothetical protein HDK64DRAFT_89068 [Phyllosticta capitalensis]